MENFTYGQYPIHSLGIHSTNINWTFTVHPANYCKFSKGLCLGELQFPVLLFSTLATHVEPMHRVCVCASVCCVFTGQPGLILLGSQCWEPLHLGSLSGLSPHPDSSLTIVWLIGDSVVYLGWVRAEEVYKHVWYSPFLSLFFGFLLLWIHTFWSSWFHMVGTLGSGPG